MQDVQNAKIETRLAPLHPHMDTVSSMRVVKSECIRTSSYGIIILVILSTQKTGTRDAAADNIRTRNVGRLDGAQARILHDGIGMGPAVAELGGLVGRVGHLVGILVADLLAILLGDDLFVLHLVAVLVDLDGLLGWLLLLLLGGGGEGSGEGCGGRGFGLGGDDGGGRLGGGGHLALGIVGRRGSSDGRGDAAGLEGKRGGIHDDDSGNGE